MDRSNASRATTHVDPTFRGWLETSMRAWDMATAFWKLAEATEARKETWQAIAATFTSLGDNITLIGNQLNNLHCPTIHSPQANGKPPSLVTQEDLLSRAVDDEIASCVKIIHTLHDSLATLEESVRDPSDHSVAYAWLSETVGEPGAICKQITLHNQALRLILHAAHISSSSTLYAPSYPLQSKITALERMIQQLRNHDLETRHAIVLEYASTMVSQDPLMPSVNVPSQPILAELDGSAASPLGAESRWSNRRSLLQDVRNAEPPSPLPVSPKHASTEDLRPKPLRTSVVSPVRDSSFRKDSSIGHVSSDVDFDVEMANIAISEASNAIGEQRWSEAEPLLKEAWSIMSRSHQAPSSPPALCSMLELEYLLALCAFHTKTPQAAQSVLLKFLEREPTSEECRNRLCDAGHLLSLSYIKTRNLDAAQIQAEKVAKGRLALHGKEHDSYYESLLFLARIHELSGNAARAKLCLTLVPAPKREPIFATLVLPPTPTVPNSIKSPTSPSMSRERSVRSLQPQNPFAAAIVDTSASSSRRPSSKISGQISFSMFNKSRDSVGSSLSSPAVSHVDFSLMSIDIADVQTRATLCDIIGFSPSGPDAELERAICEGRTEAALTKIKSRMPAYREQDSCLLHLAALFGDVEVAKVLLAAENGPPVDALTSRCIGKIMYKLTPLHLAMGARFPHMVHFLLQQGATLRTPSQGPSWVMAPSLQLFRDIWLPCMSPQRTIDVLNVMFSFGWDVNESVIYASNHRTLLGEVVKLDKGAPDPKLAEKLVEFLMSKGADPMAVPTDRFLHHAAQNEDVGVVRALLRTSRRAQLHAQDANGRDALSVAVIKHFSSPTTAGTNVIRELLSAGADIHAFNHVSRASLPARLREHLKLSVFGSSKVKLTPLQIASAFDDGLAHLLKTNASFAVSSPV